MYKSQKGLISLLIILFVLISSAGVVYLASKALKKDQTVSAVNNTPTPIGTIAGNTNEITNVSALRLTATNVQGANGAEVDNVRYYLYSPSLASGHDWGDPSWCESANPCTAAYHPGVFTYDISQSSNAGNNYEVIWNASTHSSGSTPYSRALSPQNIPPGTYIIGLRVEDVNGNVAGGASSLTIRVISSVQSGTCYFSPTTINTGSTGILNSYGVTGPIVLWAGPLTSTPFNLGNVTVATGPTQVTIPTDIPFIFPPDAPNPPPTTVGYFVVGNTRCGGTLTINNSATMPPTGYYKITYKDNVSGNVVVQNGSGDPAASPAPGSFPGAIKFNPGNAAPVAGVGTGSYTVTWEGYQSFPGSLSGIFRFNNQILGGTVKVYLDGQMVADHNTNGSKQAIKLVSPAGVHLIKVEYNHVSGSVRNLFNYVNALDCADMTADNIVNSGDQAVIRSHFGAVGQSPWDITFDNQVNQQDLNKASTQFGKTCS